MSASHYFHSRLFADRPRLKVDFITDNIKNITADGIETVDGKHTKHDVIICATGERSDFC